MELTSQGHSATLENIRMNLSIRFPHMQLPSIDIIYDSLAQLMQERKIYQTAKGYFIVTPERRRSRSRPRATRSFDEHYNDPEPIESRIMLMTNSEAVHSLYGEISTERDGDLTHQCIQTNLADVICGGNPNDKIMYPRSSKRRSASFPTPRSLERRHSLRLFGSSKRLQRCASTRSLSKNYAQTLNTTDSSSSEYHSTDSSSPKKASLLSRLFRRSGRSKQRQIETFSGQFPPAEWFNSKAVHLHSIGTQTTDHDVPVAHTLSNSTFYDGSEISQRSLTLPRRHRRHMSSESTFVISSRDCSPIRRGSPVYCSGSLPRSTHSIPATSTTSQCTKAQRTIPSKHLIDEQNRMAAKSVDMYNSPRRSLDNNMKSIRNDHDRGFYRTANSGPSSLESGKASSMFTASGPSSIDSGKISYSRTSGHSSLDSSHTSASTVTTMQSPSRSIILNGGSNTPKNGSPIHVNGIGKSKLATDTINRVKCLSATSTPRRKLDDGGPVVMGKPPPSRSATTTTTMSGVPNSNSNSSITLQVTTSNESSLPSTKIFVQNSPVRSVITLENGKLMENSNVFIINNETTTNSKGEFVKRTLSKHGSPGRIIATTRDTPHQQQQQNQRDSFYSETEGASETGDSLSLISETSPDSSMVPIPDLTNLTGDSLENSKFTKNINNDATMNNSRKFSLQMPTVVHHQNGNNSITYKNCLKGGGSDSNPTSPIYNKNIFGTDNYPQQQPQHYHDSRAYERFAGSVGNLRYFPEKNEKKINSNCDLKNLPFESPGLISKLNSNPAINTDSLAHILHKSIVTVGSEPNLAHNENNDYHKPIPDKSIMEHQELKKGSIDRRYSCTAKDLMGNGSGSGGGSSGGGDDLFNFPSLTDLSFNFTSLAAQKILQGVSINSIDTLVELNLAQEKQQNNVTNGTSTTVPKCTDYGLV